jgi:hypothetical protein
MAARARSATVAERSWSKSTAFAPHVTGAGFASPTHHPLAQTGNAMDEIVNVELLREEAGKQLQAFRATQRTLNRTIDAALLILAAFAAIATLVWLL